MIAISYGIELSIAASAGINPSLLPAPEPNPSFLPPTDLNSPFSLYQSNHRLKCETQFIVAPSPSKKSRASPPQQKAPSPPPTVTWPHLSNASKGTTSPVSSMQLLSLPLQPQRWDCTIKIRCLLSFILISFHAGRRLSQWPSDKNNPVANMNTKKHFLNET